jgi:hypothetical protein
LNIGPTLPHNIEIEGRDRLDRLDDSKKARDRLDDSQNARIEERVSEAETDLMIRRMLIRRRQRLKADRLDRLDDSKNARFEERDSEAETD